MVHRCNCLECNKPLNVLFDFRYVRAKKIELYAIEDDGKAPRPTGYCIECVKDAVGKDLDLIVSRLNNEKISFIDFRRREAKHYVPATALA
jgi:hypothetical protein